LRLRTGIFTGENLYSALTVLAISESDVEIPLAIMNYR
jgi:hypothetical protein